MDIKSAMREIQRIIGDEAGARVSKELLLVLINSEAQRVGARWPNTARSTFTPAASGTTFDIDDVFDGVNKMKIKRLLINGAESTALPASEIERLVQT